MPKKKESSVERKRSQGRVLLLEPHSPSSKKASEDLQDGGFDVVTSAETNGLADGGNNIDVVLLADPQGKALNSLIEDVRGSIKEVFTPIILIMPKGSKEDPNVPVDACLVRPVSGATLVAVAKAFTKVKRLRRTLRDKDIELNRLRESGDPVDPQTGLYAFKGFKNILATEVKRARRYRYPFSIAIAELDDLDEIKKIWGDDVAAILEGGLRLAISKCLRDLDIPVAYNRGQVLMVLPHTPRRGARVMTDRIRKGVLRTRMDGPKGKIGTTLSIGIASYDGVGSISFGNLVQEASAALQIAIQRGGNRVAEIPITRRLSRAAARTGSHSKEKVYCQGKDDSLENLEKN